MHQLSTTRRRIAVTFVSAASLLAAAIIAPAIVTAAPGDPATPQPAKIAADLGAQLAIGPAAMVVRFGARADLSEAQLLSNWDARGEAVYQGLKSTAETSQQDVRALLDERGVAYEAFFITNAIFVSSGTSALASELSSYSAVSQLVVPPKYVLDEPVDRVDDVAAPGAVEWGLRNIKAPRVWKKFGDRGKGIVVANIDTGAQWNHPALEEQYRGTKKGGGVNHNYNWFDSSGSASAPFDTNGHGTHTMGTMVGDDGGSNQIGVAPKAKWITANGCHTCSFEDLIESGEWMLAPTKVNGNDPKAKKRPHIVNNSWGIPNSTDPFMDDVINAWDASGIFGQWSNGNGGSGCGTSGSPGSRIVAYSAGAYDINNNIASFSSRGPGQSGEIKPNIAAPGVNVRSSMPGSSYGALSGTSMASPHVAGAIALLWAQTPTLKRNVDATRDELDDSSIDVNAQQCGGTVDDNNVFGEGRLDALALVQGAAPAAPAAPAALSMSKTIG